MDEEDESLKVENKYGFMQGLSALVSSRCQVLTPKSAPKKKKRGERGGIED